MMINLHVLQYVLIKHLRKIALLGNNFSIYSAIGIYHPDQMNSLENRCFSPRTATVFKLALIDLSHNLSNSTPFTNVCVVPIMRCILAMNSSNFFNAVTALYRSVVIQPCIGGGGGGGGGVEVMVGYMD